LKDAGNTNSAFAGDIYIDADTYDILKTDGTITKFSLKSNSIISAKLKELRIVSQFKPDDKGNTVLDYSTFSIKSSLKLGIVGFKTTNYTSKIFILSYDDSIDADNLNAIKPNAREKDMDQIRNAPYDAEFWKNNPVIRRTKAEDDAIVYLDQLKNKQGNIK
jgi:hypothetical protein